MPLSAGRSGGAGCTFKRHPRWDPQGPAGCRNGGAGRSCGISGSVPIVQIPPPAREVGGPEKESQKGELFESSVIQKRPFNVRTWGSGAKCRRHRSKLLKRRDFSEGREVEIRFLWLLLGAEGRTKAQKRDREKLAGSKRGASTRYRSLGKFCIFMRSMFCASYRRV